MKWHTSLTPEKWASFPLETRVTMVQNELSRAKNAQQAGYYGSIRLACERALELLDLTIQTSVQDESLGRLLRWRDRIARAYLFPEDKIDENLFQW